MSKVVVNANLTLDGVMQFAAVLNERQRYVASTTLKEPLPWRNSTLLKGDAAEAVAKLTSSRARISWCSAAESWSSR